jgi:hypothetical protein
MEEKKYPPWAHVYINPRSEAKEMLERLLREVFAERPAPRKQPPMRCPVCGQIDCDSSDVPF